jgi:cytochrome c5
MKNKNHFLQQLVWVTGVMLALAAMGGLLATAQADDAKPAVKKAEPAKKKLTGAELYAINCNRCHPERYPTEFNSSQWETLVTHMRVRANLPAKQAKEILKYLKEEAGN